MPDTIAVKDASGSSVTVKTNDALSTQLATLGTQATLAAILAKQIAAPSTEAKQDAAKTVLDTIAAALAGTLNVNTGLSLSGLATTSGQSAIISAIAAVVTALGGTLSVNTGLNLAGLATTAKQDDLAALITTIDSDLDAILAKLIAAPATEAKQDTGIGHLNTLAGVVASARAAVNLIAGQAGITADAGNVAANTPRMTLANNDPAVTALQVMDDWDESDRAKVNLIASQAGVDGNSGAASAKTLRVVSATDDPAVVKLGAGLSNRVFVVDFATLTRPANTTAYAAGDSISNNATAGSVTALVSGNLSDVNDDPIFVSEILVRSTDTGLAGKKIRAYLFNSDPTANSGVGGGDNAAFSQKIAGYVGSFVGVMETGFSDGCVGRLLPTFNDANATPAGAFVPIRPVSGARTLYIQFQAVEAFTPSGNSTTIIGTAKGWQGRAA